MSSEHTCRVLSLDCSSVTMADSWGLGLAAAMSTGKLSGCRAFSAACVEAAYIAARAFLTGVAMHSTGSEAALCTPLLQEVHTTLSKEQMQACLNDAFTSAHSSSLLFVGCHSYWQQSAQLITIVMPLELAYLETLHITFKLLDFALICFEALWLLLAKLCLQSTDGVSLLLDNITVVVDQILVLCIPATQQGYAATQMVFYCMYS